MSILEVKKIRKTYQSRFGGNRVEALRDVTFSVEPGEYVAIMGESGSGKTTLLNILAALDQPTGGEVVLDGIPFPMPNWPSSDERIWDSYSRNIICWTH